MSKARLNGGEEDELEALLNAYSDEAAAQNLRLQTKEANKKLRSMAARREAGLAQPLGTGNKGYVLLKKMGYKDGSGLGSGTGRLEPVPLDLKTGRAGLGVDETRKREREAREQQAEQERLKRARQAAAMQQRFQAATRGGYSTRQVLRHLRDAWRVAEQLDERLVAFSDPEAVASGSERRGPLAGDGDGRGAAGAADGQCGAAKGQWPRPPGAAAPAALAAAPARSAALQQLLALLPTLAQMLGEEAEAGETEGRRRARNPGEQGAWGPGADVATAAGCCSGARVEEDSPVPAARGGEGDLETADGGGPVLDADSAGAVGPSPVVGVGGGGFCGEGHGGESGDDGLGGGGGGADHDMAGGGASVAHAAPPPPPPPSAEEQLAVLLRHLRERHCYCLFCGCQYDNAEDLEANCPGLTEDLH